jgi:hypothetical protein
MLRFIRKIFREERQESKSQIEMPLQNLKEWAIERSKPMMEEIRRETEEILMKIDEERQRTKFNLEILENAKLHNTNIPYKAKQYMEGNRTAYIRSISSFLGHMEINNKNYHYLLEFVKKVDELLDNLGKDTIRSYSILQEFFANESGKIASNIKQFDLLFKELKIALNDSKAARTNVLVKGIEQLEQRSKQKLNISLDLKNAEGTMNLVIAEKDSLMKSIDEFDKSEEHNNFINLTDQKKSRIMDFAKEQDVILQSFSLLERPLRKYSHIAFQHEELTLQYINDPVTSLTNDKEFEICSILLNLERMLSEGTIQVDEKKKEKSIEEIKKLSKEFFQGFLKKFYSLKSEISELEIQINATGVSQKFKSFNRQLEELNLRIEKTTREFKRAGEDHDRITKSFSSLLEETSSGLRSIFGEEIRITY